MSEYLMVAHQTADSDALVAAVGEIARDDHDFRFSLVVPATPVEHLITGTEGETQPVAEARAEVARKALQAAGATVVGATVGDADLVLAVQDRLCERSSTPSSCPRFPSACLVGSRWTWCIVSSGASTFR